MTKRNKGFPKPVVPSVAPVEQAAQSAEQATVEQAAASAAPKRLRLPLPQAREHNKQHGLLPADAAAAVAANVALTARGTNPQKRRVYGYDNLAEGGGRVPRNALIAVVPGSELPRGVQATQWAKLQSYAGQSVESAYGNGVSSRTVRRAYRAGAIRFQQPTAATPVAAE